MDSSPLSSQHVMTNDTTISTYFADVYRWMTAALGITALVAWFVSQSAAISQFLAANSMVVWILFGVELLFVFAIASRAHRMSYGMAIGTFLLYAAINGVTLSFIFALYTTASIFKVFLVTTAMYGATSLYGYTTKRDLSGLGSFFFMALIGIIVASVINFWVASPMIDWVVTFGGIIVFAGLAAYDHQKLKAMALSGGPASLAVLGALSLYLDFINLFLYLLRVLGDRR